MRGAVRQVPEPPIMKPSIPILTVVAAVLAVMVFAQQFAAGAAFLAFAVIAVGVLALAPGRNEPVAAAPEPERRDLVTPAEALAHVVETLPDPAVVVNQDRMTLLFNDPAAKLLDALRKGHNISGAVRAPVVLDALAAVLAGGQSARVDYEQRVPIERRFEVYIAPLPDFSGSALARNARPAALLMLRDLTQQEKVERMRADFVAYASHELRTPLSAVLGFIETLQGAAKDDPEAREQFLELMRVQANRMTRLIGDLLSLSRIELNAHVRPDQRLDLEQAVRHVLEYLTPLAAETGIEIEKRFEVAGAEVLGDWDELVQVVQNLVENAMKYGQSGKRVVVSIEPGADLPGGEASLDLRVRDFGPGIAPEHLPRLTERFYRVDVTQSRAKGGTGLGLAIVKHIVNRHRGRLLIESEPGEGSVFTVRLPQAAVEVPRAEEAAE